MTARLNAELKTAKNNMSSRVDLKMVRDSAFQLSVQPFLGIEVFRAEFTVDSIKVVDRMNKRYVAERYADLKGQTPIEFNFYNLQALFTNHIFLPGKQEIDPKQYKRFKLNQEGSTAEIKVKDTMGLLYTFFADGEEKLLSTYITDPSEQYAPAMGLFRFPRGGRTAFPDADGRTGPGKRFVAGEASLSVSPASRRMFRLIWTFPFRLSINVLPLHKS